MWSKRAQNRPKVVGFTVLEMVITLTIAVSLLMLGTVQLGTYREKLILNNTTQVIKSSLEQAARISTIRHEPALIRYYPATNKIIITGNDYQRTLKIDAAVQIYNLSSLRISDNGSIPPHTIVVTNHKNTKKVKLQMTWGRAIDGNE